MFLFQNSERSGGRHVKTINQASLDRANVHVMAELMELGLFDEKMEHIEV